MLLIRNFSCIWLADLGSILPANNCSLVGFKTHLGRVNLYLLRALTGHGFLFKDKALVASLI